MKAPCIVYKHTVLIILCVLSFVLFISCATALANANYERFSLSSQYKQDDVLFSMGTLKHNNKNTEGKKKFLSTYTKNILKQKISYVIEKALLEYDLQYLQESLLYDDQLIYEISDVLLHHVFGRMHNYIKKQILVDNTNIMLLSVLAKSDVITIVTNVLESQLKALPNFESILQADTLLKIIINNL